MNIIQTFPNLAGFYVLTGEGELGYYERDGTFSVDAALTKSFKNYNKQFIQAYLEDTERPGARVAIIYQVAEKRPWGKDTFVLETNLVRSLYPVTGAKPDDKLTAFQKKNREKSIYRGMELLLEYKDEQANNKISFSPVLFDRGSQLDQFREIHQAAGAGATADTPVLELLNLIAFIPRDQRRSPAILNLKRAIYGNVIQKDKRHDGFSVMAHQKFDPDKSLVDDPYMTERVKNYSGIAIPVWEEGDIKDWMKQHWGNAVCDSLGPWLVKPYQFPMADNLKAFSRFRGLTLDSLTEIAENSPIFKAPAGSALLGRNTNDNWNLYLLEGRIELEAADGATENIDGGTKQAEAPISFLKPRKYAVRSMSEVKFLFINDDFVSKFPVTTENTNTDDHNIDLPDFFKR